MECKFADDSRLSGAGDTPEGWGAIQRDPGQAQGLGSCEPHEVKRGQVVSPTLGWVPPRVPVQAGGEGVGSSLLRKTWGCWWMKNWTCPSSVCSKHPKQSGQKVKGGDLAAFSPGVPAWEKHGPAGAGPDEVHKADHRAGVPLLWGKTETVELVQPGEKKVPEWLYCSLSVLKGGLQERCRQTF